MVRWGKKGVSYHGGRLVEGNATRERKECVERTCEGVIVLTQSDEGMNLRMIDCFFFQYELPVTRGWIRL